MLRAGQHIRKAKKVKQQQASVRDFGRVDSCEKGFQKKFAKSLSSNFPNILEPTFLNPTFLNIGRASCHCIMLRLVIFGSGNAGKTCTINALSGREFEETYAPVAASATTV